MADGIRYLPFCISKKIFLKQLFNLHNPIRFCKNRCLMVEY